MRVRRAFAYVWDRVRDYLRDYFAKLMLFTVWLVTLIFLHVVAWGAFTVGAVADEGSTRLELDLTSVPGASSTFYER